MIEEVVPKEDNMGKLMAFFGGCVAGVVGVFAVAVLFAQSLCKVEEKGKSEDEHLSLPMSEDHSPPDI